MNQAISSKSCKEIQLLYMMNRFYLGWGRVYLPYVSLVKDDRIFIFEENIPLKGIVSQKIKKRMSS